MRILDYMFYRTYLAYKKANEPAMFSSILYLSILLQFVFLPVIFFICDIMYNGSDVFYKICFFVNVTFIIIAVSVRYMKKGMIRELKDEFLDYKWNNIIPIWAFWTLVFIFMIVGVTVHVLIAKNITYPYALRGIGYNFLINLFGN